MRRMKHISVHLKRSLDGSKKTERGELMREFCRKINRGRTIDGLPPVSMGRMGKLLEKIPTKDLYYLKSVCDHASNFSKKFWWEINPKNHTEEAKAKQSQKFKRN